VTGLGVTVAVAAERRRYDHRATVGSATEVSDHLAVLMAWLGERPCLACGAPMLREGEWRCPQCGATARLPRPRHFSPRHYAAACTTCHGVGSLQDPRPEKLIVRPDKPLCAGAMHSPGFFPKGYLCQPFNSGYDMVRALADRYGFDPEETPWEAMSHAAQEAFLFGDPESMSVTFRSRTGRTHVRSSTFPGFYGWIRDWDVGGTYTETLPCPDCEGARLRPEYAAVRLAGQTMHALSEMPLERLEETLSAIDLADGVDGSRRRVVEPSLDTARRRLEFLNHIGLGYLHLDRITATLSAGEAQRVKLAGLLGSDLTALTVLIDEPSRGLHPSEVEALLAALKELRDAGNTVIVVEHDPVLIRAADHLIDMGPGAGTAGGRVVARGRPDEVEHADTITGAWLRSERAFEIPRGRRTASRWLTVRGAREHNLAGDTVRLPLGALVGVCGVSGSGKSTLLIDTLGRALAPKKQTTSVAYEPIQPGAHDGIDGAPARAILVDQTRAGVGSPAGFMGLDQPLRALFAASEDAQLLGLDAKALGRRCSACKGRGAVRTEMGFLPGVDSPCETCRGTGLRAEAWEVRVRGTVLPEVLGLTADEVHDRFGDAARLAGPLNAMRQVGLGYVVLRQPGYALSGGEVQRLKLARELCRKTRSEALYILDEPTLGQHLEDVARLVGVLHRVVDDGHTVVVVEHHPHVLASCDWLVELGPGGGPDGGRIVAAGTPEQVAAGDTSTAPYLRTVLEGTS
jgi:excinuclease ABC subunit A